MGIHRNESVAKILSLIGLVQGLGTGFNKIEEDYYIGDEIHKPFITCDDNFFTFAISL